MQGTPCTPAEPWRDLSGVQGEPCVIYQEYKANLVLFIRSTRRTLYYLSGVQGEPCTKKRRDDNILYQPRYFYTGSTTD